MRFVRSVNMKLFFERANQNKINFRFTTLTKPVNNQTNFGKKEENKDLFCIYFGVNRENLPFSVVLEYVIYKVFFLKTLKKLRL